MGRQRTVDDANFWRSPSIAECTQEDKATLLYLLTSPSSNVVGVYQIVLRVAAAEMGWTAEQLAPVLRRLQGANLIRYDEARCFVWVRVWWDHNSARMAVGPKLRDRTLSQIGKIPREWLEEFLGDFLARLSPELKSALGFPEVGAQSAMTIAANMHASADRVSDTVSALGSGNCKNIYITNTSSANQLPTAVGDSLGQVEGRAILARGISEVDASSKGRDESGWRSLSDVAELELAKIRAMHGLSK